MDAPASTTGIASLGIDAKAIIFQIINFALLLLILKWTAFKPILKILDERRKKISQSLETAKDLEQKRLDWEKKEKQLQEETLKKNQELFEASQKQAQKDSAEMLAKTKSQQEQIIQRTKERLKQEKTQLMKDVKARIGELVIAATEKILNKKINSEEDKRLIKNSLK